ncbi:putative membrane protein [Streptococcus pyogenes MGAS2111]|nr:putative membrane protein [Streptococcus pyogenes MGAS2111]
MEFTLGYWFWSGVGILNIFAFFGLFIFIPVTIFLISHLVLTIPTLLIFLLSFL